jgi:hypothetical protein
MPGRVRTTACLAVGLEPDAQMAAYGDRRTPTCTERQAALTKSANGSVARGILAFLVPAATSARRRHAV